jgi:cysteine protease ATG4
MRSTLNVGILGGRPNEAYYLVGMQGEFFIFLDPHKSENCVPEEMIQTKHLQYHEQSAKKIHYSKVDPSLGFGFYIRDQSDFNKFQEMLLQGRKRFGERWIFYGIQSKPDF